MAFSGRLPADLETSTEDAQTKLSATRFRLLRAEVNGSGPTIVPEEIIDAIATASIGLNYQLVPNTTASIDPVTTGSIIRRRSVSSRVEIQVDRNYPAQKSDDGTVSIPKLSFDLIFASSGHALIQDGDDIVPVSRGSRLPDGSTVRSVRQRDGQWQLVTSMNAILTVKN